MPSIADALGTAPSEPDVLSVSALLAQRGRYAGVADLVHLIESQRPGAVAIGHVGPASREAVRLVPHLSLAFPTSDVATLTKRSAADDHRYDNTEKRSDDAGWRIEVACFGLYGPSSPLPSYLTESLFDHGHEGSGRVKDFLDIFNHRLLSLLVRALAKHRPFGPTAAAVLDRVTGHPDRERNDSRTTAERSSTEQHAPLVASMLGRRPMSAAALEAALGAWLPGVPVRVEPCVATWTDLPPDAQARLGTPMGGGLGVRMRTCVTAFRIALGPLNATQFNDLLPGAPGHRRLAAVAREANPSALDVLVRLTTAPGALPPSALDGTARLGRTTRLDGADRGHVIDLTPSAKAPYA